MQLLRSKKLFKYSQISHPANFALGASSDWRGFEMNGSAEFRHFDRSHQRFPDTYSCGEGRNLIAINRKKVHALGVSDFSPRASFIRSKSRLAGIRNDDLLRRTPNNLMNLPAGRQAHTSTQHVLPCSQVVRKPRQYPYRDFCGAGYSPYFFRAGS